MAAASQSLFVFGEMRLDRFETPACHIFFAEQSVGCVQLRLTVSVMETRRVVVAERRLSNNVFSLPAIVGSRQVRILCDHDG